MLKTIAFGFGAIKALEWLGTQLSEKVTYKTLPIVKGDIKLLQESLTLRVLVTNNNNIPIPIKSIRGTITHEDRLLGTINSLTVISFKPKETKTLVFDVKMSADQILFGLSEALTKGTLLNPIVFKGLIGVADKEIPFTRNFEFLKTS
jgi:LEA14-like dessication related protein